MMCRWRAVMTGQAALAVALALTAPAVAQPLAASQPCPPLRWITLGTAGGPVPTPERAEPSNLLEAGDQAVLVDTGDGTVNQLARAGLDLGRISAVFISHHHHDHTGGLSAVVGLRWMNQFPGELVVYGPPGTREVVAGIVQSLGPQAQVGFGLGAAQRSPADSVRVIELRDGVHTRLGQLEVVAVANSHFDHPGPAVAQPPQSLSYRFSFDRRAITYTGDTGPSPAVAAVARGSDLLVSEVIDLDRLLAEIRLRRKDAPPAMLADMERHLASHHLTAPAIGQMAAASSPRQVVLTHFAIPPGPVQASEPALRRGIAQAWAGPVALARDLSVFAVDCQP